MSTCLQRYVAQWLHINPLLYSNLHWGLLRDIKKVPFKHILVVLRGRMILSPSPSPTPQTKPIRMSEAKFINEPDEINVWSEPHLYFSIPLVIFHSSAYWFQQSEDPHFTMAPWLKCAKSIFFCSIFFCFLQILSCCSFHVLFLCSVQRCIVPTKNGRWNFLSVFWHTVMLSHSFSL